MTNRTIIIYDSEWTSWDGARSRSWSGPGEEKELVQIGMVKLANTQNLKEIDVFDVLIKPKINPVLSKYFIDLTGITQEILEKYGKSFNKTLPSIARFLGPDKISVYCFGIKDKKVLEHNCILNNVKYPFSHAWFISAIPKVAKFVGKPEHRMMSSRLPYEFGFNALGEAHNALADARCIAQALRVMRSANAF